MSDEARVVKQPLILITIIALCIAIAHMVWPATVVPDSITGVLLAIAILPWLAPILRSMEIPGVGKFEFVQQQVQRVQEQQEKLKEEIDKTRSRIDKLVIASMSPLALNNLQKIASGDFKNYFRGQGLTWQLLYFENIGYISFKCRGIDDISVNGEKPVQLNLSDYVAIKPLGLEYLALREVVNKRQTDSNV
jgi:hypothetical protein